MTCDHAGRGYHQKSYIHKCTQSGIFSNPTVDHPTETAGRDDRFCPSTVVRHWSYTRLSPTQWLGVVDGVNVTAS